jgi:hypothetical protein
VQFDPPASSRVPGTVRLQYWQGIQESIFF